MHSNNEYQNKKKIAFITTGYFPVPPVQGGAVESLVYTLISQNEIEQEFNFTIFSAFDKRAVNIAQKHEDFSKYKFIKTPVLIKCLDLFIYFVAKKVLRKKKIMSYRYIIQRLWYILKVAWKLSNDYYDELVFENTPASFLVLRLFGNAKRYEGKYSYHLHNQILGTFGCDDLIAKSRHVIGVSGFINETFLKKFPEFSNDLVELKNCVITSSKNKIRNIRKKWRIPLNDFVVLYTGRLSEEKGVLQLIQGFNELTNVNATLLIVGGYYYQSGMKSQYESILNQTAQKSNNRIIFTGYVEHSMLDAYYETADIAVFPALWNEPAGLTIVEAMSHSLPVITTNVGGIPEYVGEKNAILLSPDKNIAHSIAASIIYLYKNADSRNTLSKAAKVRSAKMTPVHYFHNFSKIFK